MYAPLGGTAPPQGARRYGRGEIFKRSIQRTRLLFRLRRCAGLAYCAIDFFSNSTLDGRKLRSDRAIACRHGISKFDQKTPVEFRNNQAKAEGPRHPARILLPRWRGAALRHQSQLAGHDPTCRPRGLAARANLRRVRLAKDLEARRLFSTPAQRFAMGGGFLATALFHRSCRRFAVDRRAHDLLARPANRGESRRGPGHRQPRRIATNADAILLEPWTPRVWASGRYRHLGHIPRAHDGDARRRSSPRAARCYRRRCRCRHPRAVRSSPYSSPPLLRALPCDL